MTAVPATDPTTVHGFSQAELDRVAAQRRAVSEQLDARRPLVSTWIERLENDGRDTLVDLIDQGKEPIAAAWQTATAEATDWEYHTRRLMGTGNIGLHLGASRRVGWDADNAAGTEALRVAGVHIHTVSPGSLRSDHKHPGGCTALWRLPSWVPDVRLTGPTTAVELANGGLIDVLAGHHQTVLPPSVVVYKALGGLVGRYMTGSEAGYCGPERDGWLLEDQGETLELPLWALSADLLAYAPAGTVVGEPPAGLEALAGTITIWREPEKKAYEPGEGSDALTEAIGELDLLAMLEEAGVAGERRGYHTCGPCANWLREGSDAEKSITVHSCGEHGRWVQVWTTGIPTLPQGGHSRLDAFIGLTGRDIEEHRGAEMLRLGLVAPRELGGFTAEDLEEEAADLEARAAAGETTVLGGAVPAGADIVYVEVGPDGLLQRAKRCREAAVVMEAHGAFHRARVQRDTDAVFTSGQVLGALESPSGAEAAETSPAVVRLDGLPPVHPDMELYRSHAVSESATAAPPINTANHEARYLIPADTRSLLEAVTGPRACQAPVDVEATHGQVAEAVAAAVGGTKLRRAGDLDQWYGWDGIRWEINRDAPQLAVQSLINRHRQSADPVTQQRRIRAYTWKKPTNEIKAKFLQLGYTFDPQTSALLTPDGAVVEMVPISADKEAEAAPFQKGAIVQLGACPEVATRTSEFDADPAVLGTPGGYIVLGGEGITTMPPDPRLLISKLTTAAYDPTATAPMFEEAMKNALPDDDVRGFLQRVTGHALFGEQEHHTLLNLRGTGGNGKGLYQDILEAILGEYAVKLQASVLTLAGANNHSTDVLPLRGARLAFVNEIPPQQLNIDLLKELTGGGTKTARGIAKDPVTWKQSHTLILSTNNQLTWAPSAFRAMSRRLLEVRFEQEFGTEGGPAAVHGLADRIIREEASGVLNWCLEGYLDYVARGRQLDPPAKVQEWTKATLTQSSSWSAFCAVMFTVTRDKADEVTVADVFSLWTRFRAGDTDQKHASPGSSRVVGKMLAEQLAGVTAVGRTSSKAAHVCGLKWSEEAEALRADLEARVFTTGNLGRDPWSSNWDTSGWNASTPSTAVPPIGNAR